MRSVLFDFGGTLDSDGLPWLPRFYQIYKECGIDLASDTFNRAFYDADDNLAKRHALAGLDLQKTVELQVRDVLAAAAPGRLEAAPRIAARFAEESRRHFARLSPTLSRLAARYRLGIVSNFYGNLDGILSAEGLRGYFGVVADSGALGFSKPDPRLFLHASGELGCAPTDCLMVGDSAPRDIAGGSAAKMRTALVCATAPSPNAGQDMTIRSVADLDEALR